MVRTTIDQDTPILPIIIAQLTLDSCFRLNYPHIPDQRLEKIYDAVIKDLTDKAEHLYQSDDEFFNQINSKGNEGRDFLYRCMKYWCKNIIDKHL